MMHRYLVFYKPFGVLSSFTDPAGRDTLKAFVGVPGVYAAGRLDYDSEGLLLITDDGDLIHKLIEPRYHLPKTYLVQVEGIATTEAVATLEHGVVIQGRCTQRCEVLLVDEPEIAPRQSPVTPHGATSWLRIVLREGRKRQIRHMTAAVGLPTLRVLRIAIGPITLGNLHPGEWRELSSKEVEQIKGASR